MLVELTEVHKKAGKQEVLAQSSTLSWRRRYRYEDFKGIDSPAISLLHSLESSDIYKEGLRHCIINSIIHCSTEWFNVHKQVKSSTWNQSSRTRSAIIHGRLSHRKSSQWRLSHNRSSHWSLFHRRYFYWRSICRRSPRERPPFVWQRLLSPHGLNRRSAASNSCDSIKEWSTHSKQHNNYNVNSIELAMRQNCQPHGLWAMTWSRVQVFTPDKMEGTLVHNSITYSRSAHPPVDNNSPHTYS